MINNCNDVCIHSAEPTNIIKPAEYKSKLVFGNVSIMLTKKFNWFNRLMFKLVFGIKIEKIGDSNG